MTRVFTTQFPLNGESKLEELIEIGKSWVSYTSPFKKGDLDEISKNGWHLETKGYSLDIGRVKEGKSDLVGLKYIRPEGENRFWTTYLVGLREANQNFVSVSIDYNTKTGGRKPVPQKPRIISLLLKDIGGGMDGDFGVKDTPFYLKEGDESFIAEAINGKSNLMMPLVHISRGYSESLLVEPEFLANQLSGIAHVFVDPSREFSFSLKEHVFGRNFYGGAVGIYWPGGAEKSLWLPEQLKSNKNSFQILYSALLDGLNSRFLKENLSWEDLQTISHKQFIESFKESNKKMIKSLTDELEKTGEANLENIRNLHSLEETLRIYEELNNDQGDRMERERQRYQGRIDDLMGQLANANAILDLFRSNNKGLDNKILVGPEINSPMYQEEVLYHVLKCLKEKFDSVKNTTRTGQVLGKVLESNEAPNVEEAKKIVENLFRQYDGMTDKIKSGLRKIGLEVNPDKNDHYKINIIGDSGGISVPASTTPGAQNAGKKIISDIMKKFF